MTFLKRLFGIHPSLEAEAEGMLRQRGNLSPDLRMRILNAYGRVLENKPGPYGCEDDLPASKAIIGSAIVEELVDTPATDEKRRSTLISTYMMLDEFFPRDECALMTAFMDIGSDRRNKLSTSERSRGLAMLDRAKQSGASRWKQIHDVIGVKPPSTDGIRFRDILDHLLEDIKREHRSGTEAIATSCTTTAGKILDANRIRTILLACECGLWCRYGYVMGLKTPDHNPFDVWVYKLFKDNFPMEQSSEQFKRGFEIYMNDFVQVMDKTEEMPGFFRNSFKSLMGHVEGELDQAAVIASNYGMVRTLEILSYMHDIKNNKVVLCY